MDINKINDNPLINTDWKDYVYNNPPDEVKRRIDLDSNVQLKDVKLLQSQELTSQAISSKKMSLYIKQVTSILKTIVRDNNAILELLVKITLTENNDAQVQIKFRTENSEKEYKHILTYLTRILLLTNLEVMGDPISFELHYTINFPHNYLVV